MLRTENEGRVLGARGANTVHEGGQANATDVTANKSDFKSSCKTVNHTACHRIFLEIYSTRSTTVNILLPMKNQI